jgi:enoyl-CoA hydratase/carnithine racemase
MSVRVQTERRGRVLVATLARPPVNAIDGELIAALDAVLDRAIGDDDLSVLHLRSEQRAFCAGADLALMRDCFATPQGPDAMTDLVRAMQRLFARLETAPLVTLAEVATTALGGGLEMALACDLRAAALTAKLGLPEARLGLVPGAGGTQRLTRLCGAGLARRLILGAEVITGAEAERLGLVQWALPAGELGPWTAALAERLASSPKAALAANKRCIAAAAEPGPAGYAEEITATRFLYDHPETRRKVSDFLDQRSS